MIGLPALYTFAGLVFAAFAIGSLRDRSNAKRLGNAAFWGLLALSFLAGDQLGDLGNGVLVLCLVALAGAGALGSGSAKTTSPEERTELSARLGNRLFLPALIIPVTALVGSAAFKAISVGGTPLFDPKQVTLLSLGIGVVLALAVSMLWLRPPARAPLEEGRRLIDSVGWAAVLPQMLASLGAVFALAGVGEVVGDIAGALIPDGSRFAAIAVFTLGMAGFTMIMGNAFAAFPVMAAAIGVPVLIHGMGGNPAVIGAVGMLAGFCGTLMTPMAANFNIVPAALLELKNRNGVIRAQIATALPLLAVNLVIIYVFAFR
ncbi:DUF979 domain-containing protein [Sphingosinicella microcystinivorans]|uniref:Membrane protein n=1 Tax=Sphingosinicella microcystinivorans TaxID=335406 RepID=A0AAD1D2H0_SPHMI|nr:DUF979 domain-containing protein [Sphingosinicella microcystinivorans]RKS88892.1 putative membrane protein [Sphingosinicella microcystinivorans]BBE32647.1 membrane protein [Sphingosinicella microcystinivorans]